ncbi:MAG: anti-sigma factor [Chitinophagales bacterium]|nr:anti-sigma factor [Chitinophagales bacterium]
MDINAYINSGIIESYVLGLLDAEACNEVEQLALQYPEIRKEINEIQQSLESYAEVNRMEPRKELMDEIWNKMNSSVPVEKPVVIPPPSNTIVKKLISIQPYLAAAILILLLTSFIINIYLSNELKHTRNLISELNNTNLRIAERLETQKASFDAMEQQFAFVISPDTRTIRLNGLPAHQEAAAYIYWNTQNAEVFIASSGLPKLSANTQYQLWAIVDGTPVSAGLLADNQGTLQKMDSFKNVQAFAITIEPKGGSKTPTLESMVVLGSV